MTINTEQLVTFCKKKGFIYPSSDIYGGVSGLYDYGHLGTKLKHNFENLWRSYFLNFDENFHEIETASIMHQKVFKASGHLENFVDPVAVSESGHFERADHLLEKSLGKRFEGLSIEEMKKLFDKHKIKCPVSGTKIVDVKVMNMMFPIQMGVGDSHTSYLRPETAQSPFVNFKLQFELLRKKLPMGLGLIGRAYRNEISPRNLTLRQREFTQAELQIFFNPNKINEHPDFDSVKDEKLKVLLVKDRGEKEVVEKSCKELVKSGLPKFYVYHLAKIQQFYLEEMKFSPDLFRLYQLDDKEKAFYNKFHFDIEVKLNGHGFTEMGGLHYRTDHDLKGHQKVSKQKMVVSDDLSGEKFIPHVLELSFGVDRNVYALLDLNYSDGEGRGNVVLSLPSNVTPFYCAVFPLVKNKELVLNKSKEVYSMLRKDFSTLFDITGSVGRRYARSDETGVKYCITIDFESLEDDCVTIRDRDTTEQERVKISNLKDKLRSVF